MINISYNSWTYEGGISKVDLDHHLAFGEIEYFPPENFLAWFVIFPIERFQSDFHNC